MSELNGIEVAAVVPRDATAADRGRMLDAILLAWFNAGARAAQAAPPTPPPPPPAPPNGNIRSPIL